MIQVTRRTLLRTGLCAVPAFGRAGQAQAQEVPQASPMTGTRLGVTPDGEIDYLPDAWVDMYGRPTAEVIVNGQGPFKFMVDTGSTTTVIAHRHLATLGLAEAGRATVAGTTGVAEMPIAYLDKLQCGVVSRQQLRVAVLSDDNMTSVDGILGADVFAGRRLVFRIPEKSVSVEPARRMSGRLSTRGNMRVRNGLLAEIDGRVGDVKARLMLDTGAQNCIANMALSSALSEQHPRLRRVDNVRIFGVTGHKILGQFIALPRVDLKAFSVKEAGCVAAPAPIFDLWGLTDEPAMIVGVNLLSRLESFSIDYGARSFDATLLSALIARNTAAFG
jgi:hypothetical protein